MRNFFFNTNSARKTILALTFGIAGSLGLFAQKADFIFTHDIHDFLDKLTQAKLIIDQKKTENPETFIIDAGDFSMGTLYQTVFSSQAPELRILGAIGVEATTLGNHEFDFGSKGLAKMLDVARTSGETVPQMIVSNADWKNSRGEADLVKDAMERYGAKEYAIIEHSGVKAAVFGLFGKDSLFCAPLCEVAWEDPVENAKKIVSQIKANENVDMIICLSHSGTSTNPKKSEDEILAKSVPEIDLIISGHTHTVLEKPIVHGNTVIASCGAYSKYLGTLSMERNSSGRWNLTAYELIPIKADLPKDGGLVSKLEEFAEYVDAEYMDLFGYKTNQVLAESQNDLAVWDEVGYLMASSYIKSVEKLEVPSTRIDPRLMGYGEHVDMTVVPSGCVRGTYSKGPVTAKDIFTSFSLGIGDDELAGYPLVSVYLKGSDIINGCEVDASLSPSMDTAHLYLGNIYYEYNPKRLILNKVTNVYYTDKDGNRQKIERDRLYRIVSDIYTGNMLGGIEKSTFGLIKLTPRDADGNVITNLNDFIIYTRRGELKGWEAIARNVEDMKFIGDWSKAAEKAVCAKPSANPFEWLAGPSKFARIVYSVVLGIIFIIAGIIVIIVCCKKNKKNKRKS